MQVLVQRSQRPVAINLRELATGLLSNWPRYRPDERSNQRLQARKKLLWSASRAGKLPALVRDRADGGTARRAQGVTPSRLAMDAEDSPRRGGEPIAQSGRSSVIAHPGLHYLCSPRVILTKASRLLRISPLCIGAMRQNPRQLHRLAYFAFNRLGSCATPGCE